MGCGDCGFCCIVDCGFCCIGDFFSCSDSPCRYTPPSSKPSKPSKSSEPSKSSNQSTTSSYTPPVSQESAMERHAKLVADELADWRNKAVTRAEKEETAVIEEINKSISQFIAMLERYNQQDYGGKRLNIDVDRLKQENERMKQRVSGFIRQKINDRFVQTDRELSVIMDEMNDARRSKAFNDFYDRVFRQAVKDLVTELEDSIRDQSKFIESAIENRLREVNADMAEVDRQFNEIQKLKENDDAGLAPKQIEYMYEITLCDTMLSELANQKRAS